MENCKGGNWETKEKGSCGGFFFVAFKAPLRRSLLRGDSYINPINKAILRHFEWEIGEFYEALVGNNKAFFKGFLFFFWRFFKGELQEHIGNVITTGGV